MKERFVDLTTATQQITEASDIFLVNALAKLKEDQPALNAYAAATKNSLYDKVVQEHSDTFAKNYDDLTNASNTNKNVMYYYIRNKDLNKIQGSISDRAESEAMAAQHDSHLAKRQFEINEWTNGNKLDTLFVFQLIFIGLLLSAPLLYAKKLGMLPSSVFYVVLMIIFLAILFTIVIRAQYTIKTRDQRFWHKRRFPGAPVPPTSICPSASDLLSSVSGVSGDIQAAYNNLGGSLIQQIGTGVNQLGQTVSQAGQGIVAQAPTTSGFEDFGTMRASLF